MAGWVSLSIGSDPPPNLAHFACFVGFADRIKSQRVSARKCLVTSFSAHLDYAKDSRRFPYESSISVLVPVLYFPAKLSHSKGSESKSKEVLIVCSKYTMS